MLSMVRRLVDIGERQGEGEKKAREVILSCLDSCREHKFVVHQPYFERCSLLADAKDVDCLPTGLVSGKIESKENIISSLSDGKGANINFNPLCNVISRPSYYNSPSFAVSHEGLNRILNAKKVQGEMRVLGKEHEAAFITAGNENNPRIIVFTHYDSLGPGAVDNASGTAVCIEVIRNHPEILNEVLFVFDGNEELSMDEPYWGHGYRVFEKQNANLLENAEKIFVVDSVGHSQPQLITEGELLELAFPIRKLNRFCNKVSVITGDFEKLMEIYHSEKDRIDIINERFLVETKNFLKSLL